MSCFKVVFVINILLVLFLCITSHFVQGAVTPRNSSCTLSPNTIARQVAQNIANVTYYAITEKIAISSKLRKPFWKVELGWFCNNFS